MGLGNKEASARKRRRGERAKDDSRESLKSGEVSGDDVLLSLDVVAVRIRASSPTILHGFDRRPQKERQSPQKTHLTTSMRILPRLAIDSTTSLSAASPKLLPILLGLTATMA